MKILLILLTITAASLLPALAEGMYYQRPSHFCSLSTVIREYPLLSVGAAAGLTLVGTQIYAAWRNYSNVPAVSQSNTQPQPLPSKFAWGRIQWIANAASHLNAGKRRVESLISKHPKTAAAVALGVGYSASQFIGRPYNVICHIAEPFRPLRMEDT